MFSFVSSVAIPVPIVILSTTPEINQIIRVASTQQREVDLKKASVTLLDPDQFANAKTLKKLVRTLKEKRISSDTYDLFYLQYVGEGQPSDARKTILKNREKASAHSAFTLFEDVMCFWVSHTLGGEVSFEAIVIIPDQSL